MDRLDDILRAHVAVGGDTAGKLLGAAFAVVDENAVVYSGAAGRIGFDPDARRFAGDSFVWIASMTKLVTATCLMQLVERGAVGLDDDVRWRLPELAGLQVLRGFGPDGAPLLEDNVRPVTLRMLLTHTHTLGLGYDFNDPHLIEWSSKIGRAPSSFKWTRKDLLTPLKFAPGDGWWYGTGLDWAGLVLEQVTGQGLGQYMQQHIFEPLGIDDTGFWPERLPQTRTRTVAFSRRDPATSALRPQDPMLPVEHDLESGGAGLFSTTDDYTRFLLGLLQGKLLGETSMGELFAPQLDEKQSGMMGSLCNKPGSFLNTGIPKVFRLNQAFGGALNMQDVPGKRHKGSLAWSGMCNSRWWIDRETGIAAVLLVNVLDSRYADAVALTLFDELERAVYAQ